MTKLIYVSYFLVILVITVSVHPPPLRAPAAFPPPYLQSYTDAIDDPYFRMLMNMSSSLIGNSRRRLQPGSIVTLDDDQADDYKDKVYECAECPLLETCNVLSGLILPDRYLPLNSEIHGSCVDMEYRIARMDMYFGPEQTFKDTPECRKKVTDYTCLTWGAFQNVCDNYGTKPKPPCRSYCTEIGRLCANSPYWGLICYDISCPFNGDVDERGCTTGPDPDLRTVEDPCYVWTYQTPCRFDICAAPGYANLFSSSRGVWLSLVPVLSLIFLLHSLLPF